MNANPAILQIPEPLSIHDAVMSDGAVIRMRRHGRAEGPRIALSHGNGLAIDFYYPFWKLLLDRYDVILFDVRNHGQNPFHGREWHNWNRIALDMEEVFQTIGEVWNAKPVTGAFHSLSSVAALIHSFNTGTRWSPLVLFDPPIFPPPEQALHQDETKHMAEMSAMARRRPTGYASRDELVAQIEKREFASSWIEGAHDLFARSTLRQDENGNGWVLCCPRECEADIFASNTDPTHWSRLRTIEAPLLIIGSDPSSPNGSLPGAICAAIAEDQGIDYALIPGTSHFLQVEKPRETLAAFESFLKKYGIVA